MEDDDAQNIRVCVAQAYAEPYVNEREGGARGGKAGERERE